MAFLLEFSIFLISPITVFFWNNCCFCYLTFDHYNGFMLSFYQKTRGTFLSTFREKMSQSWRKIGPVFLPYDPCRCRPSRTVLNKNTQHSRLFNDPKTWNIDFIALEKAILSCKERNIQKEEIYKDGELIETKEY